MSNDSDTGPNPQCVAFCEAASFSVDSEAPKDGYLSKPSKSEPAKNPERVDPNYFKSAEWSVSDKYLVRAEASC
jgi:hypothetical protein